MTIHYFAMPGFVFRFRPNLRKEVNVNGIMNAVCDHYSISLDTLKGKGRFHEQVLARQMIFYLLREQRMGLREIGQMFGKDHTSVIHGINAVNNMLSYDEKSRKDLQTIRNLI